MKAALLLLLLSVTILGNSQVSKVISVETAGSLSTLLTESEKSTITDLTVSGTINALDIKCMRDQIANLTNLDLTNANIAAFNGIALSSTSYSYPANEMPRLSFYNGSSGKAKKTLVSIILPVSLTSIGEYAFYLCENIKSIYIGNSISNIGSESFKGCSRLTTVTMGPSVTTIQNEAFHYCYSLNNITFSENITYIGNDAFTHCSIEKVVFPSSMATINNSFRQCDYLKEVTLPASITKISNWAFQYCNNLNTIFSLNTTPPVCDPYSFFLVPNVTSVYVPASSVSEYKSAPVWGDNFYSVIKPLPSITSFYIPDQIGSASINEEDRTISVTLPSTISLNNLIATFTLSTGATAKVGTTVQTSGITANDFTNPIVYAITTEDGLVTYEWTVNISFANTEANITSFSIPNQTGSTVINEANRTISITLPFGKSANNLKATFSLSEGATAKVGTTVQSSGITANNFTSPVVYAVTSEDGLTTNNWTVIVSIAKNTLAKITSFSVPNQTGTTVINDLNRTISVTLPFGKSANNLIATFSLSEGATAKVGNTVQTSGITANNFSSPVVYAVTSEDGLTTKNWTVIVTIAKNTLANITSFSIPNQTGSTVINEANRTISITLPFGKSANNLIATFSLSEGATAKVGNTVQTSGITANDFTSPVVYAVTSEDTLTTKNWTVIVTIAKNTFANITSFNIPNQTGNTVINEADRTISVTLPYGTSVNNLIATFFLSEGATAKVGTTAQTSGTTANDFTSPVVYAVTSEDGLTTNNWTVNVTIAKNTLANITSFSIPNQTGNTVINEADRTISVTLPFGTSVNNLIATFFLSEGATAKVGNTVQTSGITANDFTSPVVYAVTSEDTLTTNNWTVNVIIAKNTLANITSYTIPGQTGSTIINEADRTISVTLPFGTSVNNLIATFSLSEGATANVGTTIQTSGTTANDFTSPVVYAVTSEDTLTTNNWTVNVMIAKNTLANITSFNIPNQTGSTIINEADRTISVSLPFGTSVNNLIATFSLSEGATAKVGTTIQTSGTTANDFTAPVVYAVTSEDELTTNNWTVIVSQITGIHSFLTSVETKIFPNPSEGIFNLGLKSVEYVNINYEIINSLGTVILNRNVNFSGENNEIIDLSHASKGIYIMRISTDNSHEQIKLKLLLK